MKPVILIGVVLLLIFIFFGAQIIPADISVAGVNLHSAALDTKASLGTVSAKAAQKVLTKNEESNTLPLGWRPPPRPQGSAGLGLPSEATQEPVLTPSALARTIPSLVSLPTPSPSQAVAAGVVATADGQAGFLGLFGVWNEEDLNLAKELGADWIRVPISLEKISDISGQSTALYDEIFSQAQRKGIKVLLVLHIRQPASDVALESLTTFLMERYGPYSSFAAIQPGNEPDDKAGFAGTAKQYWQMHLIVSRVARRYRKDMVVVTAGLSAAPEGTARPYFEKQLLPYLARDRNSYDVVGLHEYDYTMLAERIGWYQAGLNLISSPLPPPPIWVTKFGVPYATQENQAAGLLKGLNLALKMRGVQKVFVFQLHEDRDSYGLLDSSGQPKQAFWALKNWNGKK